MNQTYGVGTHAARSGTATSKPIQQQALAVPARDQRLPAPSAS